MSAELHAKIATSFEDLERISEDWRRLHREQSGRSVFTTFEWTRASRLAGLRPGGILSPIVYRGAEVVGILPLVLEAGEVAFLGDTHADYNDLVCGRTDPGAAVRAALAALSRIAWRRCVFKNLSEGSAFLEGLASLDERSRSRVMVRPADSCPTLLLRERRDETLGEMVSKKSLRRHENGLSRRGRLAFGHIEDRDEIRGHLPRFFEQHIERRALAGAKSLFLRERSRALYERIVDSFDPASELRFSVLSLDGRPMAYHLGFELEGVFTWYKPTFDVDYWHDSPGEVLIKRLLEYIAGRPIVEFDFTRGDESFKSRFTNHVRQNRTVEIWPDSPAGAIGLFSTRARQTLKTVPGLTRAVTRLRQAARTAVRARLHWPGRGTGGAGEASARSKSWRGLAPEGSDLLVFRAQAGPHLGGARSVPGLPPGQRAREADAKVADSATGMKLSQLARLSARHPELLGPERLETARRRLHRGDLALGDGADPESPSSLAWVGTAAGDRSGPESEAARRIGIPTGARVLFDIWTSGGPPEADLLRRVLREIGRLDAAENPWTVCEARDAQVRAVIEAEGFEHIMRIGGSDRVHVEDLFGKPEPGSPVQAGSGPRSRERH